MIVNQPGRGSQSHGHTSGVRHDLEDSRDRGDPLDFLYSIQGEYFDVSLADTRIGRAFALLAARCSRTSDGADWLGTRGAGAEGVVDRIPSVTAAHVFIQNAPAMQLIPVSNLRFSQPTVAHPQDAGTTPHPLGPLSLHTPQGSNGSTINLNNLANPKLLTPLTGTHTLTVVGVAGGALRFPAPRGDSRRPQFWRTRRLSMKPTADSEDRDGFVAWAILP